MPKSKKKQDQDEPPAPETPAAAPIAVSEITGVRLGQLTRAKENVRHIGEDVDVAELKEDIRGHGLLQSLIGYQVDTGIGPRVCIVGGGRRLLALEQLRDEGAVDDDYIVPVQIRDREQAIELSLAENLARRDMSPVDEFRAFKALMDLHPGTVGIAELARRFGYTEHHVKQRMRLADLHEEILDALSARTITLDSAYAYATTQDTALQLRVFKEQQKQSWKPHEPDSIKRDIAGVSYTESNRLVRFVTLAAYEAAGGRYEDDLFLGAGEERRLIDTALVERLAREAAAAAIPALVAEEKAIADGHFLLTDKCGQIQKGKPPKGFVYQESDYWSMDEKKLWATAKKAKVKVTGVFTLDQDGKLVLQRRMILVPKDGKEAFDKARQEGRNRGYNEPSPEERAAAAREREIQRWAPRLALPPFGEAFNGRVFWTDTHWPPELSRDPERGEGYLVGVRIWVAAEERDAQLEAAAAKVDELAVDAERQREAQEAAKTEAAAAADKQREELLANPPAVVRIEEAPFDFFRHDDGSYPDTRPGDDPDQEPAGEYGFESLGELLDYAKSIGSAVRSWPTIEAFDAEPDPLAGRCRICGCTEDAACTDDGGPCSWVDSTRTLCDAESCVAAANGEATPESEAVDVEQVPEAA